MNIRGLALDLLCEYEAGGKYVNLSLSSHRADGLTREERAALTALLYTTVERKLTYDYYISALSGRSTAEINPRTLMILRLGLCQLCHMRSVPAFAAVNETVSLARNKGERAFVNGVLRAAARAGEALPLPDPKKNYRRYLSVKHSFPTETVRLFISLYGQENTERLLECFNGEGYTDLTVNTRKIAVEDYLSTLKAAGIAAVRSEDAPLSLRIEGSVNPERLPGFAEGYFLVQDRASLISAYALGASRGERIIDVCACPGGKSLATAILTDDNAEITSLDIHESKLSLIEGSIERLGLKSVSVAACDATEGKCELFGSFDKVICDVPCSGLGVLGKKPDLRYKSEEAREELPALQYAILSRSAEYLKVGGELVYSTCTLDPRENREVLSRFLEENRGFVRTPFAVGKYNASEGELTLTPHEDGTDGFFMAKIRKIAENDN